MPAKKQTTRVRQRRFKVEYVEDNAASGAAYGAIQGQASKVYPIDQDIGKAPRAQQYLNEELEVT